MGEGLLLGLYALLVEPSRLALTLVRRIDPSIERPRRFLLLSDTHLHPWSRHTFHRIARASAWARATGATHVLIAGDVLETDEEADAVAARLRHALGDLPAVYVSGNHEVKGDLWWQRHRNDPRRIGDAMGRHGIERLDERVVELDGVPVVGIGWRGWRSDPGRETARLLAATDRPALVLAHSPDHIRGLRGDRVLLAVCGHTHGGQVRLPGIGAPWIPVRAPLPRFAGAMVVDGIPAYVTRGIGAMIPLRLGAVPEAVILELGGSGTVSIDATKVVEMRTTSSRRPRLRRRPPTNRR
ncbi:MAG: metallophosphoesterase family protein [Chloroflexi bacterium]|nr:metallophosphoesterase family protein [Chloroflexota bacterium]